MLFFLLSSSFPLELVVIIFSLFSLSHCWYHRHPFCWYFRKVIIIWIVSVSEILDIRKSVYSSLPQRSSQGNFITISLFWNSLSCLLSLSSFSCVEYIYYKHTYTYAHMSQQRTYIAIIWNWWQLREWMCCESIPFSWMSAIWFRWSGNIQAFDQLIAINTWIPIIDCRLCAFTISKIVTKHQTRQK